MDRDLDECYAKAAEFDKAQFDKYIKENFEQLCRRTNYPKLGYIIHQLNEDGILSVLHGESFHAPILWVEKCSYKEAYLNLIMVDHIDDDDERFLGYEDTVPDVPEQEDYSCL